MSPLYLTPADMRCPSCDHTASWHDKNGCDHCVVEGRPGWVANCSCAMPRNDIRLWRYDPVLDDLVAIPPTYPPRPGDPGVCATYPDCVAPDNDQPLHEHQAPDFWCDKCENAGAHATDCEEF